MLRFSDGGLIKEINHTRMGIEDYKQPAESSEQYADAITWLQEQGFGIDPNRPETVTEAVATLEEESRSSGEDILAAAPASLTALLASYEAPKNTAESAPLPLEEMAAYLSEKTGQEIGPDDTALMLAIYKDLESQIAPASGVFSTHPETDPFYDLSFKLKDGFDQLSAEMSSGFKEAA